MTDVAKKVESFFAAYTLRLYSKGQVLLLNGDQVQYVFYVIKGTVKQYDVSYRGDEVILNLFKPPAFFPMSHAINDTPNTYIYEAETDVQLRQAPVADVVAFLKENPDVVYDLLSRVYRGLDGLLGRMARLMVGSASSRLVYELIVEAKRFGKKESDGVAIFLTEKDLGARAGLTRETVSRELSKLKKLGLLELRSNRLVITNMPGLQKRIDEGL
ncbi:MAG TPA: Crp/Fnr family transcriptional regulator [Candidatus Saccharimonadales bacterium]|nr:Crp/Fnr family transcriptional regulator [Candidatus Saccharimonadales bacterium]